MKKYFAHLNDQQYGPLTVEELATLPIRPDTLVWTEGMTDWQPASQVADLKTLFNQPQFQPQPQPQFQPQPQPQFQQQAQPQPAYYPSPPKKSGAVKWILIGLGALALSAGIFVGYKFLGKKNKPVLNAESINQKFDQAVVLIKHSYIYTINLGGKDYYFSEFDKKTGEIKYITENKEEAKKNPNTIYGTGFFIDNNGSLLTNRHVVDVRPSDEDSKLIIDQLKNYAGVQYSLKSRRYEELLVEIERIGEIIESGELGKYDAEKYLTDLKTYQEELASLETEIGFLFALNNAANASTNKVSKHSFEFGIFMNNGQYDEKLKGYIRCQSTKISDDPRIDLAMIQTRDKQLPAGAEIIDLERISNYTPGKNDLKLGEQLYMLGFNNGVEMAATTKGFKAQLTDGKTSRIDDEFNVMYTIPALPGSSGSPVMDQYGQLVCVNFAGIKNSQSFNYGVSPVKIRNFLGK